MFWFHCGRCGSLFQSDADDHQSRLCPECGFDPCTGIPEPAGQAEKPSLPTDGKPATKTKTHKPSAKRYASRGGNRHVMLKLMGGWTLVLALIVFGARQVWQDPNPGNPAEATTDAVTAEDAALLHSATPKCWAGFSAFLASSALEQRAQFVLAPGATASLMSRFYSLNPWTTIDPATLQFAGQSVLHLPGNTAIETHWKSQDGKQFDAVFRQENDEWFLDWEHFSRYSDYPWPLYLAGSGPDDGEFRLLARERLAEERKEESTISIVLYAPRFGQPEETGFQSPEFLVPRDSRDGRLLTAAFQLARDHKRPFGARLPDLNPDDMIRLRIKIRRSDTELGRRFEITSIAACHWYSIDDPGVDPSPLGAPASPPASSSPSIAEP